MPGVQEWIREKFERAAAGEQVRGETIYLAKTGAERVAEISFIPIRDETGRVVFVLTPGLDITERARQYQATFENAAVGMAHVNEDLKWTRVNGALCRIIGYAANELIGGPMLEIVHPDDRGAALADIGRIRDGKIDSYDAERRCVRKGGASAWIHLSVSVIRKGDGSVHCFCVVFEDISARKQAEERVHLLMREMNHRSKNVFSLVQAVARQTATSDPNRFIERFTDRIQALAANQDLLAQTNWQGVEADDLVRAQLAHFSNLIGHRISWNGPKLRFNGAAAQAVGMALHEFATNASKYGALSTDAGHVDIDWHTECNLFMMNWTEHDGPPVRPPTRRGFGGTIIESMAKGAVDGEVQLEYDPEGVAWHLTCPAVNALEPGDITNATRRRFI